MAHYMQPAGSLGQAAEPLWTAFSLSTAQERHSSIPRINVPRSLTGNIRCRMNACLMLTLPLAAFTFLSWVGTEWGAQKTEKHSKSPEAIQQILWQSIGDLPVCWLALLTTSVLAK